MILPLLLQGQILKLHLENAPFPHPLRANGHSYQEKFFSADAHYSDNSVLCVIPENYKPGRQNDFVIHFHGWNNTIDSVNSYFHLGEQFLAAQKNALFIIPQGPKNASDSFGGKVSDAGGLERLMSELTDSLIARKILHSPKVGNIILTGHSGGYSPIAFILMHGGLRNQIKEVHLYDGLYSHLEKYTWWFTQQQGRFFHITTDKGGTKWLHQQLAQDLSGWQIPFWEISEEELTEQLIKENRIILCHSRLGHNDVLHQMGNFQKLLAASCLKPLKN
jgi:hypothetical protein